MAGPDPAGGADPRPVRPTAFAGVAVASLGGPLALVTLYMPGVLDGATRATGLVTLAAGLAFLVPLAIWIGYSTTVHSSGGLYEFVRAGAGPRTAAVQATLWIISYLLYLVYTTAYVVYDLLPSMLPGVRPYRTLLELAIPIAVAAALVAGRAVTLAVIAALAAGQLLLVALVAVLGYAHLSPAAALATFAPRAPAGATALATGNAALLYICGSLPLFLGGEVARPAVTPRRWLLASYGLVAAIVVAATVPVVADPAGYGAGVPGFALARAYGGRLAGGAVAIGVAGSVVGLMMIEYLALGRLLARLSRRPLAGPPMTRLNLALGAVLVLTAPLSLLDPERFYTDLLKPSLVALWLSQLPVVLVYPRFAANRGRGRVASLLLAAGATALLLFGLYSSIANQVVS